MGGENAESSSIATEYQEYWQDHTPTAIAPAKTKI